MCTSNVDEIDTWFNFINILSTDFTLVDPECVKKIDNLTVFFMLLGSVQIKAVRRILMKLTPGVNFNNILGAHFSYEFFAKAKT
jgi:hypothetical protein